MKLSDIEKREFSRYQNIYDFDEFIRNKTFLITGSKGMISGGIIRWLMFRNEKADTNVTVIASTRKPEEVPDYIEKKDAVVFCRFGEEKEFCKNREIDYIIHSASPTGNSFHAVKPVESLRVIIDETEKMLEIACEHPHSSMIYLSSEEAYGLTDSEEPIDETYVGAVDSLTSRSCYPLGKKVAELLCHNYSVEYDVNVKIIRPTNITGLFQPYSEERVVNEILRCVVEKKNLIMKSAGLTKKCAMYSLDAVTSVFTVLFKGESGEAYNASNPATFMSVKDMAAYVFGKFRPDLKVELPESDTSVAEGYLPHKKIVQNIEKIKKLGWKPETSLDEIFEVDIERFKEKMQE